MYEIKGNKEVCSLKKNETTLCDSHTKLSGKFYRKIERHVWQSTHGERVAFTREKEIMVQTVHDICDSNK